MRVLKGVNNPFTELLIKVELLYTVCKLNRITQSRTLFLKMDTIENNEAPAGSDDVTSSPDTAFQVDAQPVESEATIDGGNSEETGAPEVLLAGKYKSPEELETFRMIGYTIGGMMLFPGNRIGRKMTINGARGFHPRIKDRFDHTVECIRRHYRNEPSPLSEALRRYADFFGLFRDFRGYVEFFLLQDLVTEDCSAVKFLTPFENFTTSPLPASIEDYRAYRQRAIEFIEARNHRILQSC